MQRTLSGIVLLALSCSSANASLDSRAGGLAYWDSTTNLTWVADANLAQTSGYDADGLMDWSAAQAWISSLNAQDAGLGYLGKNDWRLPMVTSISGGCEFGYTGTDCGYNVDLATGEMAHLFYGASPTVGLGNTGYFDTSGTPTACSISGDCLTNVGPFSNLQSYVYWYGTTLPIDSTVGWFFYFTYGEQNHIDTRTEFYAWAVRDGDIAAVPIPPAVWLFGSALGLMGVARRKISS